MKRIFSSYVYGNGPRDGCWWDMTIAPDQRATAQGEIRADVAIVGGGFTGVSAAYELARGGASVVVLEAKTIGWGASGRNGGFCCLGGSRIEKNALVRRAGPDGAQAYAMAEKAAVDLVGERLDRLEIDADRHSDGETMLAHRPKDRAGFEDIARAYEQTYGVTPVIHEAPELTQLGLRGPFHGAITMPIGFGLNPRKYLFGTARAAEAEGARVFDHSTVTGHIRQGTQHVLTTDAAQVICDRVIFATNAYSSESLPRWMAGRYLPTQSTVIVTDPIPEEALRAQGWTSDQMSYDTRNLLHYFRLMPDRRFLFGMRGGILASPRSQARSLVRVRRDFDRMFPAWRDIPTAGSWSGLVCLARDGMPYAGPVPGLPGAMVGMAYHGNGVAMGSYVGAALARTVLAGNDQTDLPEVMRRPLSKFPFGRARRILVPGATLALALQDQ